MWTCNVAFCDHLQVWRQVWILEARSENGCAKWHFWVWNRVGIWRTGRHTPTKNSSHCGRRLFVLYPFLCPDVYIIDIIRWRDVITKLEGNDLACFKINRKDGSHFIDPVSPSTCVWICGFKDFHVRRRIRIQIEFARPYVSGFTLSSSANLKSNLQLMRKFYCRALFR